MNQDQAVVLSDDNSVVNFSLITYAPNTSDFDVHDTTNKYYPLLNKKMPLGAQNMLMMLSTLFTIDADGDLVIYSTIPIAATRILKKVSNFSINPAMFSHRKQNEAKK